MSSRVAVNITKMFLTEAKSYFYSSTSIGYILSTEYYQTSMSSAAFCITRALDHNYFCVSCFYSLVGCEDLRTCSNTIGNDTDRTILRIDL